MAITDSLISYYKLDEASGSRLDATASGNDLTDNNTVTSAAGIIDNAGQFTAANTEYLSHASNSDFQTGNIDFSIQAWVYLDSKASSRSIVSKYVTAGNAREYLLLYSSGPNRFKFAVSSSGSDVIGSVDADNLGSPSTGTWYHIIAWHDATANTVNIVVNDGTVDSSSHSAGVHTDTGDFEIGAFESGTAPFDGRIDKVGLWKKVLSGSEITELYNSGAGLAYPFTGGFERSFAVIVG